jgi:hypothetical protein
MVMIKMPSRVHHFPIKFSLAKDTEELYKVECNDLFQFLHAYEREKGLRIKFLLRPDTSSIWKTTGQGDMAKVKSFPCHCCAVKTAILVAAQVKD